jgi:hypothetical protein
MVLSVGATIVIIVIMIYLKKTSKREKLNRQDSGSGLIYEAPLSWGRFFIVYLAAGKEAGHGSKLPGIIAVDMRQCRRLQIGFSAGLLSGV